MLFLQTSSKVKLFGRCFFMWSIPLIVVISNILTGNDFLNSYLLYGFLVGVVINIIWRLAFMLIESSDRMSYDRKALFIN